MIFGFYNLKSTIIDIQLPWSLGMLIAANPNPLN
jgi:hypothetical protein